MPPKVKAEKQYRTFQLLSNHFIDSLRGIDTLKLLGSAKIWKSIFASSERFRKSNDGVVESRNSFHFCIGFFHNIVHRCGCGFTGAAFDQ